MRETIVLHGVVTSGLGEGTRFMALDWVLAQCRQRLGFTPYAGTFNLRMSGPRWAHVRQRMQTAAGVGIAPATGFCAAKCFALRLGGRVDAFGIVPAVADYPHDKLEIIAPVALRDALGVTDGDRIDLRVELDPTAATGPTRAHPWVCV
ncbi:MAG TPA: CTP-dependent riboflavin kinase [Rhodocyclaceae bacterium]|nr:CTP-dependent riboflavin kinase [Rhodocyclaceae bacterium]